MKLLTYELRSSASLREFLERQKIDWSRSLVISWPARGGGRERITLVAPDGTVFALHLQGTADSYRIVPANDPPEAELRYAREIQDIEVRRHEAEILTSWVTESTDPLPSRLQAEFRARLPDGAFVLADAIVIGIDQLLIIFIDASQKVWQATYDFTSSASEGSGALSVGNRLTS